MLFGGLMVCGFCGGAVVAVSSRLYGCCARHDRGESVCRGVYAPRIETDTRLLSRVRDDMLSPAALAELHETVDVILRTEAEGDEAELRAARSRLQEVEK